MPGPHAPNGPSPSGTSQPGPVPIAVVGLGCRFPGADSPAGLWQLLCDGEDTTSEVPADRFDVEPLLSDTPAPGKLLSRRAGYLADPYGFDADFFGLTDEQATELDPQQRLLMMTVWEAFEDAGVVPERIAGSRSGVFVGYSNADYGERQYRAGLASLRPSTVKNYPSLLSGRLSFVFDLRGPSVSLNTACSSSLTAVHLACQSLRAGETGLAVAAGVNLKFLPDEDVLFSQVRMVAPDGRSKFGDVRADGFSPGEGIGAVVLKRLETAVADGDRVRAVILGSAVTNDGSGSGVVLRPTSEGQRQTMEWAYEDAGVDPAEVDYVEAHGTGTPLIDPLELTAFGEVFAKGRPADRPLVVGSVKTNVGHAQAAAGMAGLIKTVLCLEHRTAPPSLHFETPNPKIPWERLPLTVPTTATPLGRPGTPVVAGVSSQGLSCTNAHVVLREADAREHPRTPAGRVRRPFSVSAKDPRALEELVRRYVAYLAPGGEGHGHPLRDICYSASVRRQGFGHRFATTAETHEELVAALGSFLAGVADGHPAQDPHESQDRQGSQDVRDAQDPTDAGGTDWGDARFVPLPSYPWQLRRFRQGGAP
ncbi:type I polyketide synthase [Streptomyces sp. NPDC059909]|uniref:type I polyketide synthase n=1 Tax=Streptomyces sp. NPDC059909 TaxID=3346998 RepID=UPI00364CCA40